MIESETTPEGRWILVSGLLFVGARIVGLLIASPPAITAPTGSLIGKASR
jgi:hypothetical protein